MTEVVVSFFLSLLSSTAASSSREAIRPLDLTVITIVIISIIIIRIKTKNKNKNNKIVCFGPSGWREEFPSRIIEMFSRPTDCTRAQGTLL